ncbi:MAG: GAF domain-containing sensor histidine kinase [Longimicrobiales bacterium]
MTEPMIESEANARVSSREALRFLTVAGRVLSASLDPDETLRRLVRLAVPRVACFAMIDLIREDGAFERVAYGHIDESKERFMARPGPFLAKDLGFEPIERALADGEPQLIEDTERDRRGNPETRERLRRLDARSLMIVPLVVRDRTLGALTFGSTRSDRFYNRADLSLARELARSAGLALENARLYRQAEQAIASRDEVLAVVSHDLRNPVNRVRMGAELLLESFEMPPGSQRVVNVLIRAADEMNRLIGDLLDVTRIEAGRLSIKPARVALFDLLDRLEEAHAQAATPKRQVWRVERPAEPVNLHADEGRLLQALGNLVGNAMKFSPVEGVVRVAVEALPDIVRIGVHDSGPGMDATQLAHVFDRFWQARPGDRRGAGLGLAIARGIAEAHNGRLWLESQPGVGTRAWLELPRDHEPPKRFRDPVGGVSPPASSG